MVSLSVTLVIWSASVGQTPGLVISPITLSLTLTIHATVFSIQATVSNKETKSN